MMAAKYVLVATMEEGQIETTAHTAEEVLDLRDRLCADPTCHEMALYRLVCVERVDGGQEPADLTGISYLRSRVGKSLEAAG